MLWIAGAARAAEPRAHIEMVTSDESGRPLGGPTGEQGPMPLTTDSRVAAVFDLDGTILASNLVESYVWTRLASLPRRGWPVELLSLLCSAPRYALAEHQGRAEFIHCFLRRYSGTHEETLRTLVREAVGNALLHRVRPEAVRQIRAHRSAGHRTVLVTGSLDLLVEPLRPLFDDIVACRMGSREGVMTGRIPSPPVVGDIRGSWVREYTTDRGLDVKRSYAYADSYSDRALLETVGHPCAVNPDRRLLHHAAQQQWPVVRWGVHTTTRWEALAAAAAHSPLRRITAASSSATDNDKRTS
jgi:fatty acyl-CoA reductase